MKSRGKLWKYFLLFLLAFSLSSPLSAESETELEIPELEPEATYEIQGQDLMTLYQTIKELNEVKNEWRNLTLEAQTNSENALELAKEFAEENEKLVIKNKVLFGTTVVSVSFITTGIIAYICSSL